MASKVSKTRRRKSITANHTLCKNKFKDYSDDYLKKISKHCRTMVMSELGGRPILFESAQSKISRIGFIL